MLRFVLVAIALLTPSVADAAIGVLPVDASAMGTDAVRTRLAVTDVVRDVLRGRLRALTVVEDLQGRAVNDCLAELACLQGVVERTGVDEIAHIVVERTGERDPWAKVTVRMFDPAGARVFIATQTLTTSRTNDLKGLLLQAFEPARYIGRLEIVGLAAGDRVWLDNLLGASTMNVRPGAHRVRVAHADGSLTTFDVDVPFEGKTVSAVPKRQGGVAIVPALVGSTAVVAGAVGVVAGVFGYGFYDTALVRLENIADRCEPDDATCADSVQTNRAELNGGRALSTVGTVAGGLVGVAGVIVVVAAVLPALFPPTVEDAP